MEPNTNMNGYGAGGGQMPPNQPQPPISYATNDDTKTLGTLSIVFAFIASLVGLIISIVGKNKAKRILQETGREAQGAGLLSTGLICSIIMLSLQVIGSIIAIFVVFSVLNEVELNGGWEWDNESGFVLSGECDEETCAEEILPGKWDCADGTTSIDGYQFDDDGNVIGHDGSRQNPDLAYRYEFDTNSVYEYSINDDKNYLRGSYTSELFQAEDDGKFEYILTVKFSEFVADGETIDEYTEEGHKANWLIVVNPEDTNKMGFATGNLSTILECIRADN